MIYSAHPDKRIVYPCHMGLLANERPHPVACVQVVNVDSPKQGKDWSNGICAYIEGNGALALRTDHMGKFQNRRKLAVHVKQEGGGPPDVHINLSGKKVSDFPILETCPCNMPFCLLLVLACSLYTLFILVIAEPEEVSYFL
jgi:hypothetical protein